MHPHGDRGDEIDPDAGHGAGTGDGVGRVLRRGATADLVERLSSDLSRSELTSVLLEVARRRAASVTPAQLLASYEQDRFVRPWAVDPLAYRAAEQLLIDHLPAGTELVGLSPVVPLGTHSVVGTVDQHKVVTTIRSTEVAADPTNSLALEAASRRRRAISAGGAGGDVVRLAGSARVVRAQRFEGEGLFAHFGIFGLVTAGRDPGGHAFESSAMAEHLAFHVAVARAAGAQATVVTLSPTAPAGEAIAEQVIGRLAASGISAALDRGRATGRGYYDPLSCSVTALRGTERIELSDGGFVGWTAALVASAKERCMISGMGIDRAGRAGGEGRPAVIEGRCDPSFEPVREAFAANFADHDEIGAAVAIDVGGRTVVDLWGGHADAARTRPWAADTIVDVFSSAKPVAALALLQLVDRGQLDLDEPLGRRWPRFAADGAKASISARTVLAHRAGLPGLSADLPDGAMYDWELMTEALADEPVWWEPGTRHGYHVNTFGFLVGEIVRRVAAEGIADVVRRDVAGRAGADFAFGLGPAEDDRIAEFCFPSGRSAPGTPGGAAVEGADAEATEALRRVYANPPGVSGLGTVNTRAWRAAVHPSTNGHSNARGLVAIYRFLAAGGAIASTRLVSTALLDEATAVHSDGTDAVLQRPSRFGLGFQLTQPERPIGPNDRVFGHFGAGGSLAFADRDAGVAFAYVMNRFGARWQDPRNQALVAACYACC